MTNEWKDGLPPVGVEVELNYHDSTSWRGVVTAIGNKTLLFMHKEAIAENGYLIEHCTFTPIKSKQEIERDKAIDEMHNEFKFQGVAQLPKRASLELLYDNGYRKQGKEVSKAELASFISKVHGLEYLHSELHEYFTIAHKE